MMIRTSTTKLLSIPNHPLSRPKKMYKMQQLQIVWTWPGEKNSIIPEQIAIVPVEIFIHPHLGIMG